MLDRLRRARLLVPTIMSIAGLAVLVGLGTWQMQRRTWKEALIATLAARAKAPPIPLAEAIARQLRGEDIEYLRVRVRGRYQHPAEVHLHAIERGIAGWHVVTPLLANPNGLVVFVNRGFVPQALKAPSTRAGGLVEGEAEFTGLVRSFPVGRGAFVPDNNTARNEWYWLELPLMLRTAFTNTERPYAPFLVDMEPVTVAVPPAGGATRLALANRHFEYALTWYGLAMTLAGVYGAFAWSRLRRTA